MRRLEDNPYLTYFKLTVYLGIIANVLFAIPAVFQPYWLLAYLHLPWVRESIWLRDAGGLLFFLTLMQWAAAHDPFRYKINAAVTVLGRVLFGVFWFWAVLFADRPTSFLTLAVGESVLAVLQLVAYVLMMRYEYLWPEVSEAPEARQTPVRTGGR